MARFDGCRVTTASRRKSFCDRNQGDLRRRRPESPLPTGSHQLHGPRIPNGRLRRRRPTGRASMPSFGSANESISLAGGLSANTLGANSFGRPRSGQRTGRMVCHATKDVRMKRGSAPAIHRLRRLRCRHAGPGSNPSAIEETRTHRVHRTPGGHCLLGFDRQAVCVAPERPSVACRRNRRPRW